MEKQACTVSAMKPAQATSDGDMKKLLVAQYGHASDEELWYPFFTTTVLLLLSLSNSLS